jgi:hypothetical protein
MPLYRHSTKLGSVTLAKYTNDDSSIPNSMKAVTTHNFAHTNIPNVFDAKRVSNSLEMKKHKTETSLFSTIKTYTFTLYNTCKSIK